MDALSDVAPGWDRYALEAMYLASIRDKCRDDRAPKVAGIF